MPPDDPPTTHRNQNDARSGKPRGEPTCGVNMTFNYIVGAVATAVGLTLVYLAWNYFAG